jgi:hypothetical protein
LKKFDINSQLKKLYHRFTPLDEVLQLASDQSLFLSPKQSNRYGLQFVCENGGENYYFSTPVYQQETNKLICLQFQQQGGSFTFWGSNCIVIVDKKQMRFIRKSEEFVMLFKNPIVWTFANGALFSERLSISPTYNGVMLAGDLDAMQFDVFTTIDYESFRKSKNCVGLMENHFKPFFNFSALFAKDDEDKLSPLLVSYFEQNKHEGKVAFFAADEHCTRGVIELNFYEPKMMQDTPVSEKRPNENNAFGAVAWMGQSSLYGSQWLYFRPDFHKVPEMKNKVIQKITLYLPCWNTSDLFFEMNDIQARFCSFGLNWENKISIIGKRKCIASQEDGYLSIDVTKLYSYSGKLTESIGTVLTAVPANQASFQIISTADCYARPPILCVRYAN